MTAAARARRLERNNRKPLRDRKYLAWIRILPCVVCYRHFWRHFIERKFTLEEIRILAALSWERQRLLTEAAHVGQRGFGQKCSDRETIPLCGHCHRTGPHALHRLGKNFWSFHGIDRRLLISELILRYEEEHGTLDRGA